MRAILVQPKVFFAINDDPWFEARKKKFFTQLLKYNFEDI